MSIKDIKNLRFIISKCNNRVMWIVFLIIACIISSFFAVLPTQFIGALTDVVTNNVVSDNNIVFRFMDKFIIDGFIGNLPLLFIFLYFLTTVLSTVIRNVFCYFAEVFTNRIILKTRESMFENLVTSDYVFFASEKRSKILYKIINNVSRLDLLFGNSLYNLGSDIIDLIWISFFIIIIDYRILLILISIAPLIFWLSIIFGRLQRKYSLESIKQESKMGNYVDQVVTGIEVVRVYNGENKEKAMFNNANRRLNSTNNIAASNLSLYFIIETALRAIGLSLALVFSLSLINKGVMSIGSLSIIVIYGFRFYSPISNFTKYYQNIQKGLVAANEICEFIVATSNGDADIDKVVYEGLEYDISIENVDLEVNDKTILHSFSQCIRTNEFIIIKGESGTGKTTLLVSILGLRKPKSGRVLINGISSLEKIFFSYVSQYCFLHDSILIDNVLYPKTIESAAKENVIKAKNILEKLGISKSDFYKHVGENGKNLSGGERQRVSLARAIIRDTPIVILDEVTANVDIKTENIIADVLEEIKQKKTIIFVTHSENPRLLSIADRIINM